MIKKLQAIAYCAHHAAMLAGCSDELAELRSVILAQEKEHRRAYPRHHKLTLARTVDYFVARTLYEGASRSQYTIAQYVDIRRDYLFGALLMARTGFKAKFLGELAKVFPDPMVALAEIADLDYVDLV